jgi:hypothetical protein
VRIRMGPSATPFFPPGGGPLSTSLERLTPPTINVSRPAPPPMMEGCAAGQPWRVVRDTGEEAKAPKCN